MDRAVERLLDDEIRDVGEYAEYARAAFRGVNPLPTEVWNRVYERGVLEAFRRGDLSGLVKLVALVSTLRLDVEGRLDDAIAHVDFALAHAGDSPDERVILLSRRAPLEAVRGSLSVAEITLETAERLRPQAKAELANLEFAAARAAVAAIGIPGDIDCAFRFLRYLESKANTRNVTFVLSWLTPALIAVGRHREAAVGIQSLRTVAEAEDHGWRLADAAAFAACIDSVEREPAWDAVLPLVAGTENWLARWRVSSLGLHVALQRGRTEKARAALETFDELLGRAYPGFTSGLPYLRAVAEAWADPHEAPAIDPPEQVHLMNLGATLAGMEAVSIAGSQRQAAEWLAWSREHLPAEIVTAADWPAVRQRLDALLAIRAGDVRGGARMLQGARRWADEAGYAVEAALARVELAEVASRAGLAMRARAVQEQRRAGWDQLRALHIDASAVAYHAASCVSAGAGDGSRPRLSARELDVLAGLAEGLTYRQIGERLGISWRTAQTHATNVYGKLGVTGRHGAVSLAREEGIL